MAKILVIPSIDIKDGKNVHVVQGIPELNCREYNDDPIETAMLWRTENAKCIHVVDFDAAQLHSHKNFELIAEICESVIIPVQIAGGIVNFEDAKELLDSGAYRLVIGRIAFNVRDEFIKILEKFGPRKIAAAIDVIDDHVYLRRAKEITKVNAIDYAMELIDIGVTRFVVTDIKTNGTLKGPNIILSREIAMRTGAKVTLAGGIAGYPDLNKVNDERKNGIDSVIIGRALYQNAFPCQKIWRIAESGLFN